MKKLFALLLVTLSILFVVPSIAPAYAQSKDWGACVQNGVPSLQCIPVVFGNLVWAAMTFVGSVAVILIVYSGIRFVTSGGDPKKVHSARQIMTYAIIGLVVVLCSFGIIYFISYTTGVSCIAKVGFNC